MDVVEDKGHVDPQAAVALLVGAATVYLLVVTGIHALAERGLAGTVPVIAVLVVMWVVVLLSLEPGTSVLLLGLAIAASLADHVRRANRAVRQPDLSA